MSETPPQDRVHHAGPDHKTHTKLLRQVGWLGHKAGHLYDLADVPKRDREPGGYSPVYIEIGDD